MFSTAFTPTMVYTGVSCLISQLVFLVLFAYVLPKGPWTELPSFTAHTVVCFPFMIYLTYQGMTGWFGELEHGGDAVSHILDVNDRGVHIGQVVLGMMLFWDIPTGLCTPALRDPLMVVHHFGMAFIAGVVVGVFSDGQPVGSYYSLFFLGVIEVSSIFLTVVDIFHPKNKGWNEFLKGETRFKQFLRSANEVARIGFAITFLATRAIYFPYVQVTGSLPDFYHVASLPAEERQNVPSGILYGVCFIATLFAALQMYWGFLVARQVVKALGIGASSDKKSKNS